MKHIFRTNVIALKNLKTFEVLIMALWNRAPFSFTELGDVYF
jgi:hypothetical protein